MQLFLQPMLIIVVAAKFNSNKWSLLSGVYLY